MAKIWTLVGAALLFARTLPACSITLTGPPQVELDRSEYVFAGTVAGYVGPSTAEGVDAPVWGLQVRPVAVVYMPNAVQELDIYYFGLAADCSTVGFSLEALKRAYPLQTEVLVVAWPSAGIQPYRSAVTLSVSWSRGSLTVAPLPGSDIVSRRVDYAAAFKLPAADFNRKGFGPSTAIMQFELHKEYARLAFALRAERIEILNRLRGHPWSPYDLIVRKHLGSWSRAGRRLVREWKASNASPQ